ncbi:DUF3289 family protein [Sediminibacterium sp.]|uniref:DUF3289 family protein n=1 Tax=Sediminibacterium sp. TaxID=1917865 RepID=UPI003F6FD22A
MKTESVESKFFAFHRSLRVEENAILEFVKRRNSKSHFVEETVKRIGYPLWDKMFKATGTVNVSRIRNSSYVQSSSNPSKVIEDTYYIPFVKEDENNVNAVMVVKAAISDTTINYISDWQYKNKTHGSTSVDSTAERHALFFMMLDYRTFGHKEFTIKDNNLFTSPSTRSTNNRKLGILVKNTISINGILGSDIENLVCLDFYICGTPWYCGNSCDYLNNCGLCYLRATPICGWTQDLNGGDFTWLGFNYGDIGGGSEGGGSSGGGNNNGGSDLPPIPCEGPPSQASLPNSFQQIKQNNACDGTSGWLPFVVYSYDYPFNYPEQPYDAPDEPIINNGVSLSDEVDPGNGSLTPPGRLIAKSRRTQPNIEDMLHGTDGNTTGILNLYPIMPKEWHFNQMKDLFHACTFFDFQLKSVADEMIQKFKDRTGGEYTNPLLNAKVAQSSAMINYIKKFGKELNDKLRETGGNLNSISELNLTYRPKFNGLFNKFHGLQILINDTESTDIHIDKFQMGASGSWSAEVTITIFDHFGIDKTDVLKYQFYHGGFSSWWILQRTLDYVPFKTVITVKEKIYSQL